LSADPPLSIFYNTEKRASEVKARAKSRMLDLLHDRTEDSSAQKKNEKYKYKTLLKIG